MSTASAAIAALEYCRLKARLNDLQVVTAAQGPARLTHSSPDYTYPPRSQR